MVNVLEIIVTLIFLLSAGWLIYQKIKLALPKKEAPSTPTTATSVPNLATPATPSGGRKSWTATIVILAVLGIAGYLLVTNWVTVQGFLPKTATEAPKLSFGCSPAVQNSAGNWVITIGFTESGIDATQCVSGSLFAEGRSYSLTATGETVFSDSKNSSVFDANGAGVNAAYGYGDPAQPAGAVLFTVDGETLHFLGTEKYFQIRNNLLEVYSKKGGVKLENLPVTTQSPLRFGVNCIGVNDDGNPVCTAGYKIQLEFTK